MHCLNRLLRLLLTFLLLAPVWAFAAPGGPAECARLQAPLDALCSSFANAGDLLPAKVDLYLHAYASAATAATDRALAEEEVVRALAAEVPEIASARRMLVSALGNASAVEERAILEALVCPTVLGQSSQCLGKPAYLAGASEQARAARAAILAAMAKYGNPECRKSGTPCVVVSPATIEAVVWMHAWLDGIKTIAAGVPACARSGNPERCAASLKARIRDAAAGWVAGARLADWKGSIPCLAPAQQEQLSKAAASWQGIRKSASGAGPDFLADPKVLVAASQLADELRAAADPRALASCAVAAAREELRGAVLQTGLPVLQSQTTVLQCDKFDLARGYVDDCTGAKEGYLGLRLSYSPPSARVEGPGCATTGSLSILVGKAEDGKFAVIDSGIGEIRLPSFCIPAKRLALLPYPRMRAVQLNRAALASALNLVIPKPVEIDVDSVSLGGASALALTVKSRLRVPGLTQPVPFELELGNHARIDPARLFQPLQAPLRDALAKRLGVAIEAVEVFRRPPCFSGSAQAVPGELYLCLGQPFKQFGATGSLPVRVRIASDGSASVVFEWDQAPVQQLASWMGARLSDVIKPVAGVSVRVKGIAIADDKWRLDLLLDGAAALQDLPLALEGRLRGGDLLRTFQDDLSHFVVELQKQALQAAEQRFMASVQDFLNGTLSRQLNIRLLALRHAPLAAVLEVAIPGITAPVTLEVREGADLRATALAVLEEQLNNRFKGTTFQPVPSVTISEPRFTLSASGGPLLRVSGRLPLSSSPPLSARVSMPLIPLGTPEVDTRDLVLSQLSGLFNALSVAGWKMDGGDRPTLTFAGMVPIISLPISATMNLGPDFRLTGGVTVILRPDAQPRIGRLQVGCGGAACWVPAGPGFVIGNPRGSVDLDSPSTFSLMATVTFAPGDGVDKLTRFEGTLQFEPQRLRLIGETYTGEEKLSDTVGEWDFRQGVITLDSHPGTFGLPIPPPAINIVLDGADCLLAGGANANFMGLTQVRMNVGIMVQQRPCGGKPPASLQQARPEIAAVMAACKDAGGAKLSACGSGNASVLGIANATVRFAMPVVPPASPRAHADFDLSVLGEHLRLEAEVRPHFAKIETRVIGVHLAILVPGLESYSKDQLVDAIKKILEPSFDLSALTRRDITISLLRESSGDGDPSSGFEGEDQSGEKKQKNGGGSPPAPRGGNTGGGGNGGTPAPAKQDAAMKLDQSTPAPAASAKPLNTKENNGVQVSTSCEGSDPYVPLYLGTYKLTIARANACLLTGDSTLALVNPWDKPSKNVALPAPPPGPGPEWASHFYTPSIGFGGPAAALVACRNADCNYEKLWIIPLASEEKGLPAEAAEAVNLAELSDHIVSGPVTDRPVLPATFTVLTQAIAWKKPVPEVTCLQEKDGQCIAAIAKSGSDLLLEVYGVATDALSPVGRKLYAQLCAGGCHRNAAGAEAVRQLVFLHLLGSVRPLDRADGVAVIATSQQIVPPTLRVGFLQVAAPAAPVHLPQRLGIFVFPVDGIEPAAEFDFAPDDAIDLVASDIIPRLARQSQRTPSGKWLVKSSGGREPRYLAGLQKQGADPQVFAAVRRGTTVSLRVLSWSALSATMRRWRAQGLLSGPGVASAQALTDILIDPKISSNGFHINPLLLFGDGILKETQ